MSSSEFIDKLKSANEINPDKHDGSYELVRETVKRLANVPRAKLDVEDMDMLYLMTIGTWKSSADNKIKKIENSHLDKNDKDSLIRIVEKVRKKAENREYENSNITAGGSFGMFGTGFLSFGSKTPKKDIASFISLCIEVEQETNEELILEKTGKVLKNPIGGLKAASASQILHCLKPSIFPILNSVGVELYTDELGLPLKSPSSLITYIDNLKMIRDYRDKNMGFKNFRVLDVIFNSIESVSSVNESETDYNINRVTSMNTKNTILYGPPGTGKTYNVINRAIEIIDGEYSDDREEVIQRYNELKEAGQIDFITFHQSFSYEEFIEGIKPKNDSNGSLIYDIEEGVLKSICTRARIRSSTKESVYDFDETKINFYKMSLGNTQDDGNEITDYCIENGIIALGYGGEFDYTNARTIEAVTEIYKDKIKDGNKFPIEAINRFRNWMQVNDIVVISAGNYKVRAIGKIVSDYFFDDKRDIRFNHYRKVEWLYKDAIIPVNQILKDKVFSQQTIYQFYKKDLNIGYIKSIISSEEKDVDAKPFVLIIDEINRGNISKIFGELITLIEEDKRLGAENELTVTLPYSKEKFGVPSNLYIVGTMNTADRSIALMDTALRRRFTFEEMMPDLSTIDGLNINGIDIKAMLSKINERIEFLYDRDHTIGHAYFINLVKLEEEEQYPALCGIFSTKIIPLLQEYFYEDWEKIQLVLGDHYKQLKAGEKDTSSFDDEINKTRFIQSRLFSEKAVLGFDHEDYEDRVTYSVNPELNGCCIDAEAFIKIYR